MGQPRITVQILHTETETDFGIRHSWQSSLLTTAHDDEPTVRRMTTDVIHGLAAHGIAADIVESTVRTPFPREW